MRRPRTAALLACLAVVASGLVISTSVQTGAADTPAIGDSTISLNNLRDGWDDNEPGLTASTVTASNFGQLFAAKVDGQVYAQPLVVKQSAGSDGTVVVATENDSVYGLNPATGATDWQASVGTPWASSVLGCGDLTPDIGVTSTPVYDPATNTVYVMARNAIDPNGTADPNTTTPVWQLHALDATSGQERAGWPVLIGGHPDNDPTETFNSETAAQRPGLLLLNGVVYAGFASYCDYQPYDGYVVGVSTSTAKQTALFSTEVGTASGEGGIWQSGGGLVSDGPNQIIVTTGNGDTSPVPDSNTPPTSLSEAVVRLAVQTDGTLKATDWFSPLTRQKLDKNDSDLGAGGPVAIPADYGTTAYPNLLVQDGKDGHIYLLNRSHLGGLGQGPVVNGAATDDALSVTGPFSQKGQWGHPAFWGGAGGAYVYLVENNGFLRALQLGADADDVPTLTSVATSTATFGYTSGSPVVTSDGDDASSALVWLVSVSGASGSNPVLTAYNASPVNGVIPFVNSWPLDPPGVTDGSAATGAKFTTVATDDGRVFVGTRDGYVFGFGVPSAAAIDASPTDFGNVPVGSSSTLPVTLTATRPVTVDSVSSSGAFAVALPDGTTTPVALDTGQTLTVDATFSPAVPNTQSANLVVDTTEGTGNGTSGDVTFDLVGYGTAPGLSVSPAAVGFGAVRVGTLDTSGLTVVNTSGTTESFTTTSTLAPPFSSSALPKGTTTLAAGASLAIPLTFTPTKASTGNTATLAFTVTSPTSIPPVVVTLTGRGVVGAPLLKLVPKSLFFGLVPRGKSVTKTFKIRNVGNTPLTLQKAAPPSGEFTTTTPVSEGSQILPHTGIVQTITFRPTKRGLSTAVYLITGNDGKGHQVERLSGYDDVINDWYARHDGSKSLLGAQTGRNVAVGTGYRCSYANGRVYWSAKTGVHEVHGPILARYVALGGAAGRRLGFPVTNVIALKTGDRSRFSRGWSIYWSRPTGAWAVYGKVLRRYLALGAQHGELGYPTGETHAIRGGFRGRFTGGTITWTTGRGYVVRLATS
jgi:hypothetical protein